MSVNRSAPIAVRPAAPGDLDLLVQFNAAMAEETEGKRLDPERLRRGVARVLADPACGFYRVAEIGGAVAGGLLVTFEWSDWRAGWWWWLQSVYVRPGARGRGVFSALLAAVEAEARPRPDVVGLRLYVERRNHRAQAVYAARGFVDAGYRVYERVPAGDSAGPDPAPGSGTSAE
jgi:GNAT superfamily N-acetyltransferase